MPNFALLPSPVALVAALFLAITCILFVRVAIQRSRLRSAHEFVRESFEKKLSKVPMIVEILRSGGVVTQGLSELITLHSQWVRSQVNTSYDCLELNVRLQRALTLAMKLGQSLPELQKNDAFISARNDLLLSERVFKQALMRLNKAVVRYQRRRAQLWCTIIGMLIRGEAAHKIIF